MRLLLVGNPNCGKTTLFNALTGENQRVGNWPGVTVEKKTGTFVEQGQTIQITDLPGIYSLVSSRQASLDEQIAALGVIEQEADLIINVIDACHLERHLYLTSQLLELGKPMIVALNMMDLAHQRGISIQQDALADMIGCPVLLLQAHRQTGVVALKHAILSAGGAVSPLPIQYTPRLQHLLQATQQHLTSQGVELSLAAYMARRVLEGDALLLEQFKLPVDSSLPELADVDVIMADRRYQAVHEVTQQVQQRAADASEHFTARLDRWVLHRVLAIPLFLGIMYLMFFFAIHLGGAFQEFFDKASEAIFIQGAAWVLDSLGSPAWLTALCAYGVGKGINTTLAFIPVMAAMYFFLSLLEASGYMARAAFVVDRVMRALGLPGKSFVPMIVGFGCNVPAIMAARTLDSERDRLLTVLMSPFMSCSARLAIYAVFVAAFFPSGGQNVVFSLYLIGILMAVFTGYVLRNTLFQGDASPLILELPAYHRPNLQRLCRETGRRLRYFIVRAGKVIVPVCVLLGGLNAFSVYGILGGSEGGSESVLSWIGRGLTPLFSPMGITEENWPATVGLLTGMLAKEVVVGSLNTLYMQIGNLAVFEPEQWDVLGLLGEALLSIPQNLAALALAVVDPSGVPEQSDLSQSVYGIMGRYFDGKAGAYAYLLFVLLYIPCVSTMAAVRQEAGRKLMWFSVSWSFLLAYVVAVIFYQLATVFEHPQQTLIWVLSLSTLVGWVIFFMGHSSFLRHRGHCATANS